MAFGTIHVQGPIKTKYQFGLSNTAQVVVSADQKEFAFGVDFTSDCPPEMKPLEAAFCDPNTGKTLIEGFDITTVTPFRGYSGLHCKLPGAGEDFQIRAQAVFDLAEWPYIEETAWTGSQGNTPFLTQFGCSTNLTPTPGTPVTLEEGIGLLDAWIAFQQGSMGQIWSPRLMSGWWARNGLMTQVGGQKRDPMDNPIAFVNVDGVDGPEVVDGAGPLQALAGQYWLFATGPVQVRLSATFQPSLVEELDRKENDVFAIVERNYLVGWGCCSAGVLVDPTP